MFALLKVKVGIKVNQLQKNPKIDHNILGNDDSNMKIMFLFKVEKMNWAQKNQSYMLQPNFVFESEMLSHPFIQ